MKVMFKGASGAELAGRLDSPADEPKGMVVFAHCFTCSKELVAVREISKSLVELGFAVFSFDFTGLGSSDGDFANTNFSSNVEDLRAAIEFVEANYQTVDLLVGHSLGGAAVLYAQDACTHVKGIVTIGAPAEASHVEHLFSESLDEIEQKGSATVSIGGRPFEIKKQFIDDLAAVTIADKLSSLEVALLVMHSPVDQVVGVENARDIFQQAKHPKSFVSLDDADHLLLDRSHARYAAHVIAAWSSRYLAEPSAVADGYPTEGVIVAETGNGKFQNRVKTVSNTFLMDEPTSVGGLDSGPTPYDLLGAALGGCTAMTLRLYSDHKGYDYGKISVGVTHDKVHAADCADCSDETKQAGGSIEVFRREISIEGLPSDQIDNVLRLADKCPVHKTLHSEVHISTEVKD